MAGWKGLEGHKRFPGGNYFSLVSGSDYENRTVKSQDCSSEYVETPHNVFVLITVKSIFNVFCSFLF